MQSVNKPEGANVKFRFKNIGPVKEAELELGDLTIIAGRNNTGKTYLAYALYGFLKISKERQLAGRCFRALNAKSENSTPIEGLINDVIAEGRASRKVDRETLNQERKAAIGEMARLFSEESLSGVFSAPQEAFAKAAIEVEFSGEFPEARSYEVRLRTGDVLSIKYDGAELIINYRHNQMWEAPDSVDDVYEWIKDWLPSLYLYFLAQEISALYYSPFILSAERFGISLFYKELDSNKSQVLDILQQIDLGMLQKIGDDKIRASFSPFPLIDSATSRYALPIKDNIDYTRGVSDLKTEKSEIFEDKLFDDIKEMMEGYYRSAGGDVQFRSKARKERSFDLPLHRASSSARGLSDLYFFLRHVARKDHLLIVDEPESHLDTANQIAFARLMARLARAGLKVLITTHSDYIIKEINNLIMLSKTFESKESVIKRHRYKSDDYISPDSIRAYVAENDTLTPCIINQFGIEMPFFDRTIDDINRASNDLASRLIIEEEEE